MAAAPDGRFLVVWQSAEEDGSNDGIYARLFAADGTPATPEIPVNEITRSGQRAPNVAVDPEGNFAVTWADFDPRFENGILYDLEVKLRLFRPDGTPATHETLVNQNHQYEQRDPDIAFAPNGTLILGWTSTSVSGDGTTDAYVRRFSASPGQEPCAVAGSRLFCDTGRTGGEPEIRLTFGGRPGEVTLLGDADGDGRDDVCAWRAGRFRCDLDHEGAPAEWTALFGLPTDTPLFGDVDGDGRAEPCVHRKRRLLCDTGHDGGKAETTVVLGRGTETPLLGDLDGDGRDDLCLVEAGQWTCLTRAGVRSSFAFGLPGDAPVLGDLDRDGRADPCVLRGNTLLCADGATLALDLPAGARPLFGNLDGL